MPKRTVRLVMDIDTGLKSFFDDMAREHGTDFAGLMERGVAALKAYRQQRRIGRRHMGFVRDRTKLDAELLLFS